MKKETLSGVLYLYDTHKRGSQHMRSNKLHNSDLFTAAANSHFQKRIKTQSKQALEMINAITEKLSPETTTDIPTVDTLPPSARPEA